MLQGEPVTIGYTEMIKHSKNTLSNYHTAEQNKEASLRTVRFQRVTFQNKTGG